MDKKEDMIVSQESLEKKFILLGDRKFCLTYLNIQGHKM
jgi:hypothetical protein